MGLASKLAAAQRPASLQAGGAAPGAAPSQQQQPYGVPSVPQQAQPPYNAPSQSPYGQPPQTPQTPYGQPPQGYGQPFQSPYGQPTQSGYPLPGGPPPVPQASRPGQYAPPAGPPPGQGPPGQYGAPTGGPPSVPPRPGQPGYGQQSYPPPQSAPPPGAYGAPPPGTYGAPPSGAPPAYGAPPGPPLAGAPPAGGDNNDARFLQGVLEHAVVDQNLQAFYPPGSVAPIAQRVAASGALDRVAAEWRMPREIASDLVKLALFDVILYLDDSGSMAFEEGGERIEDLKLVLTRVAYAASLFDQDGIQVRFMNSRVDGNGIRTEQEALALLQQVKFSGLTPLGTSMQRKILEPLVLGPARQNALQKPVLIITLTDGTPAGEDRNLISRVIRAAHDELARSRYGADAVSFQIAQIGNDMKARQFLEELDNDQVIGGLIDCTSNYELEADEMMQKAGQELTPELWLVKLLMGGIDSSYDEKDETR